MVQRINMSKKIDIKINGETIRRQWDDKRNIWYFSVVDVISIVTESSDPRNYWKVLKSRLNKANPQLVTRCNQLKLPSSDGKSYTTDTADSETMIEIIQTISIPHATHFRTWFDDIESISNNNINNKENYEKAELMVDVYEADKYIIIESMIAGVPKEDISISMSCSEVIILGRRLVPEDILNENYIIKEIYWGTFSRTVHLPCEIDINEVEATIEHGLLIIKLLKINKSRTRTIKIKSIS